jgi:hypothetical protein
MRLPRRMPASMIALFQDDASKMTSKSPMDYFTGTT